MPDTSRTPIPVIAGENLKSKYSFFFGDFDPIWYKGMAPATKAYYLQSPLLGKPPVDWSGWAGPE